jgi:hypothetical protein
VTIGERTARASNATTTAVTATTGNAKNCRSRLTSSAGLRQLSTQLQSSSDTGAAGTSDKPMSTAADTTTYQPSATSRPDPTAAPYDDARRGVSTPSMPRISQSRGPGPSVLVLIPPGYLVPFTPVGSRHEAVPQLVQAPEAKSVELSSVRPVLLDLPASDLTGPLALFQSTSLTDRDDMLRLMSSLNSACDEPLDGPLLARTFDRAWEELRRSISEIASDPVADRIPRRSLDEKVDEVLWVVRAMDRRTAGGGRSPSSYRFLSDSVVIDLGDIDASAGVVEFSFDEFRRVNEFLDGVYSRIHRFVQAYTYGKTWILYDPRRRRTLRNIGTTWARQNGDRYDQRVLTEAGIDAGMVLMALRVMPEIDDITDVEVIE